MLCFWSEKCDVCGGLKGLPIFPRKLLLIGYVSTQFCRLTRQVQQSVQFRVPGLETFELELPAETKVRERLRDEGDVADFCDLRFGQILILWPDAAVSLRWCEEDGQGILQHRTWAHAPHLQRPSAEGLGHPGVLWCQGTLWRLSGFHVF